MNTSVGAAIIGTAGYLLGRRGLKEAEKAQEELEGTLASAQQELTAQAEAKALLERQLDDVRTTTIQEKERLQESLRATEEQLRANTTLIEEAQRANAALRQQIAEAQQRPSTGTSEVQTDSIEEEDPTVETRSMDAQTDSIEEEDTTVETRSTDAQTDSVEEDTDFENEAQRGEAARLEAERGEAARVQAERAELNA